VANNEYKRYFIILQEDDKGYEMSPGKIPTGYVKIEVKNNKVRLNAFIQNIKFENRIEYRLILVASNKKLAVDIGKIIIDSNGRGELSYELESDNVLKSGLRIEDFNVAAISSGVSVPLSGYTGREKLEWKGKYDVVNRQAAEETPRIDKKIKIEEIVPEIPEPPIHVPIAPIPEPPINVPIAPEPEPIVAEQPVSAPEIPMEVPEEKPSVMEVMPEPEPEPEVIVKQPVMEPVHVQESKVEVEIAMPKCPPMAPMEEPCEMKKEKIECKDIHQYYCDDDAEEYEYHNEHDEYPYYSGGMYRRLKRVLQSLRRYEPFEKERGYNWFKVGDDIYEINSVTVPYMGYMMPMGYPFMSEGCSMMIDRKDYILGVKYEEREEDEDDRRQIKYLLFGVPSIYSKKNEQYYKSRGFMKFKPHKSKDYGYFILCLNLRSGLLCHMD
jgi:hypothetical protein